jgi:hypothetical protein
VSTSGAWCQGSCALQPAYCCAACHLHSCPILPLTPTARSFDQVKERRHSLAHLFRWYRRGEGWQLQAQGVRLSLPSSGQCAHSSWSSEQMPRPCTR